MTCSPANPPDLIQVSDLIYPPEQYERRFLTGWWTRGVLPLDSFVQTNWAGLVIPQKITFTENFIEINFPGRHWEEGGCNRSMPKVKIIIQYLCNAGRSYLQSQVWFGKDYSEQIYAGHNGALKYDRIPLEKIDEPCSIERTANIPIEKKDELNIRHLADWLVTMIASPISQNNDPTTQWLLLFADYTETDLSWAPCAGCLYPTQNWSVPAVKSEDNMLQLEARLATQTIKALGDLIVLNTIPENFNVPMCIHGSYLEVSLPDLSGVFHMREYFNCDTQQYFTDEYKTIPVGYTDLVNCFQFPEPEPQNWPDPESPEWVEPCPEAFAQSCVFACQANYVNTGTTEVSPFSSYGGVAFSVPGQYYIDGKVPKPNGNRVTVIASSTRTTEYNITGQYIVQGYDGPRTVTGCVRIREQEQTILYHEETDNPGPLINSIYAANNNGFGWTCNSTFNGPGSPPPPRPNIPPDDTPQGPNGDGDCFLEGELIYQLQLKTVLGDLGYSLSIPVRAKVPNGTADLGVISGSLSGTTLSISTQLGGNFTADLSSLFAGFNAVGNAISSALPVSFGLRNVRVLCP